VAQSSSGKILVIRACERAHVVEERLCCQRYCEGLPFFSVRVLHAAGCRNAPEAEE
jgi:hypothetical protein